MIADSRARQHGADTGVQAVHDVLIVGGGVAGLSLAWRLAGALRCVLVEAEAQPGYHASGRSAAMFMETYGTPTIQALTRAGRAFFTAPPAGFTDTPLLAARGVLYLVREDQRRLRDETLARLQAVNAPFRECDAGAVCARVPCIRRDGLVGAIEEPDASDVDVHALLQGFLRGVRTQAQTQSQNTLRFGVKVVGAQRTRGIWQVALSDGTTVRARRVVNAAGAWAQELARLFGGADAGLQPMRRSAFTFPPEREGRDQPLAADAIRDWPAVVGIDESFYFKPDAGQLLGSPANADPVAPHDVVAEELDVALGIARIAQATDLRIRRPRHTWAGLRTFARDGEFVIGPDPHSAGFFWLAGQGGYGIQTAAGASLLARNLLLDEGLDDSLTAQGVDPERVSPARFSPARVTGTVS